MYLQPIVRAKDGWLDSFNQHQILLNLQNPEVAIIGDSISKGLQRYSDVWKENFSSTLNLGVGGDRVEHVLWRIQNYLFPASVKVVIVICGTNNIGKNDNKLIAATLEYAAECLLKLKVKPWIMTLLPRGLVPSKEREAVKSVNSLLTANLHCVDVSYGWVNVESKLLRMELFHTDFLHLSSAGNSKLACRLKFCINTAGSIDPRQTKEHPERGNDGKRRILRTRDELNRQRSTATVTFNDTRDSSDTFCGLSKMSKKLSLC